MNPELRDRLYRDHMPWRVEPIITGDDMASRAARRSLMAVAQTIGYEPLPSAPGGAQEPADPLGVVLADIRAERRRQDQKWGADRHQPDGTGFAGSHADARDAQARCQHAFREGFGSWWHILSEEVNEAGAESDPAALRAELVQVAAVAAAWIEDLDRAGTAS